MASVLELEPQPEAPHGPSLAVRKTLHVVNGELFAGAERVQDLLAGALPEFGFGMEFVCLKEGKFASTRRSTVPLQTHAMQHRLDIRPAWRIAQMVREQDFCLVHAHTPRSAMIGCLAAKKAGVPFVYHVHSPAARDSTRWLQNRINAWSEKFSLRRAAAMINVSRECADYMRQSGFQAERTFVVPNGVPALAQVPNRTAPRGVWNLGVVALFRPRKGLEVLLDAMARMRDESLPVRLTAVGGFETPDYEAAILQKIAQLKLEPVVSFTGFTRDVSAAMQAMDLFVLPSLFGEGLPMVVLEAMANGVPIIATSVGGIPEVIRPNQDGLLVPPEDPQALVQAVRKFTTGQLDWQQIRNSAVRRQAEHFSDRSMAQGLAGVYREVLES